MMQTLNLLLQMYTYMHITVSVYVCMKGYKYKQKYSEYLVIQLMYILFTKFM